MKDDISDSRSWCFTVNNYTDSDWIHVKRMFTKVTYGVVGEEIAPLTGTPHLQGFASFKNVKTIH